MLSSLNSKKPVDPAASLTSTSADAKKQQPATGQVPGQAAPTTPTSPFGTSKPTGSDSLLSSFNKTPGLNTAASPSQSIEKLTATTGLSASDKDKQPITSTMYDQKASDHAATLPKDHPDYKAPDKGSGVGEDPTLKAATRAIDSTAERMISGESSSAGDEAKIDNADKGGKNGEKSNDNGKIGFDQDNDSKVERDTDKGFGDGRYKGARKNAVNDVNGAHGLSSESKNISENYSDSDDKKQGDAERKQAEAETAANQEAEAAAKGTKEEKKEKAKGSLGKGKHNRSEGRSKQSQGRQDSKEKHSHGKDGAAQIYGRNIKTAKTISEQYSATKGKPGEAATQHAATTEKAMEKAERFKQANVSSEGFDKGARLNAADNMVKILDQAQPMLDQIKGNFDQAKQIGQQALAKSNQGKRKADQGNQNIGEGIGTILGGIAQISEGIPQLFNIFTIPLGIANIAMGSVGIAQGAAQIGQGKEELEDGNEVINDAQVLNRRAEERGQIGNETADGMVALTGEVMARLDAQDENGGQMSPQQQMQTMMKDQKKKFEQEQKMRANGQAPKQVENRRKDGEANITNGTKQQQNGVLGMSNQGGSQDDYEEMLQHIERTLGINNIKDRKTQGVNRYAVQNASGMPTRSII